MSKKPATIPTQFRLSPDVRELMHATQAGLATKIASISNSAFAEAAIIHYATQLAKDFNDGKNWSTGDPTFSLDSIKTFTGARSSLHITADWARMADKTTPETIWLCQKTGNDLLTVAQIDTEIFGESTRWHWQDSLRRAGYVLDDTRETITTATGDKIVPITRRTLASNR